MTEENTLVVDMPYRAEFNSIYQSFSKLIYGIASRITRSELLARSVLTEVFICFSQQGLLTKKRPLLSSDVLRVTFTCIAEALANVLPPKEILERISLEKVRLLSGRRIVLG